MRIAATNKVALYTAEYNEVYQQTQFLQTNLGNLARERSTCLAYLQANPADKMVRQRTNQLTSQIRSTENKIRRNQQRLVTLNRMIYTENQRIATANQKACMRMYNKR